jgi:hypothetical protein
VVVGAFGPVFFLGTMPSTMEPARFTLDFLSWPIDGNMTYNSPATRFLSALTGGFLLGWGVMIWLLSSWVYDLAPEQVRKTVPLFGFSSTLLDLSLLAISQMYFLTHWCSYLLSDRSGSLR